jgi:hypothetical protein
VPRQRLEPGSPQWWVERLDVQLKERRGRIERYDAYYRGEHRLAFATEKFRKAFGSLFEEFADNWCELVVDAVDERLDVEGFRIPTDDPNDEDPQKADADAWEMWQRNRLDAESQMGHVEALIGEQSYGLVWFGEQKKGWPTITIEHPNEMIVEESAENRHVRAAALKRWSDGSTEFATLYLPTEIFKFERSAKRRPNAETRWVQREIANEQWPLPNPLGVVPVVPLPNRPRLLAPGESELRKVVPLQDATNKLVADMMVASEYTAFRQRWATGLELPKDPETGKPIEGSFKQAMDRFWYSDSENTKFGEFEGTDLQRYVYAIEMLVQHIASQTRTPPHYFYLKGSFPSGESIKSAETGLVAKTRRKARYFGEGWEEIIRLGFKTMGDKRADAFALETIWADPESRTEGEHIDAVLKRQALGVPLEQLWEDAGYTPQQIARFKQMQASQALFGDQLVAGLQSFNADLPVGAGAGGE